MKHLWVKGSYTLNKIFTLLYISNSCKENEAIKTVFKNFLVKLKLVN